MIMFETTNLFHKLNYILYIVTVTMIAFTNVSSQHKESVFQYRPDYCGGDYERGFHDRNNAGVYDNIQSPMLYNRENSAYSRGRSYRGLSTRDLQSLNARYIHDSERTVAPFITRKKTVEIVPNRVQQRNRQTPNKLIDWTPHEFPTKILYNSIPNAVHAQHNRIHGPVDVRAVPEVRRPIIQEVVKNISPYRKVNQEIIPVEEEVGTIVANNDNYGHARYQLRPAQHRDYETYEQKTKTEAYTTKKENNNDNNGYKSRNNPSKYYKTSEQNKKNYNYNSKGNNLRNNLSTYDQDDRNSREVKNTDVSAIRERDNKKYDDQLNSFIGALYPKSGST